MVLLNVCTVLYIHTYMHAYQSTCSGERREWMYGVRCNDMD